jgi:8-oxo-dGTP diphosphatase
MCTWTKASRWHKASKWNRGRWENLAHDFRFARERGVSRFGEFMPVSDQNINPERYMLIPRVLIFATRGDSVLLLKLLPKNGTITGWTGKYNGIGGHIEQGEDALSAAQRELFEESGLKADLRLCGTLLVDTGQNPGIGLLIFTGECGPGEPVASAEGLPEFIPWERLDEVPLVDDGPAILERIRGMGAGDPPFSARSAYDDGGRLTVRFGGGR